MASHVAQRSAAKIEEASPLEWSILRTECALAGWAKPDIPIKRIGNRLTGRSLFEALRPKGTIRPGVYLFHIANLASPDHLAQLAHSFVGMPLVAHLCSNLVFSRCFRQLACFPNGVCERLLHVDLLPAFH